MLLVVLALLRLTTPLHRAELGLLDARFLLRHRLVPSRPAPDVIVVGWDDASFDQLPQPDDLWLRYYATVARMALTGGAKAVALDIIPRHADPEGLAAWVPLAMSQRGKLFGIAHLSSQGRLTTPMPQILAPLGAENLVLANLPLDLDGVFRAERLEPLRHPEFGRESWPLLAPALAGAAGERPVLVDPDWEVKSYDFVSVLKGQPVEWKDKIVLIGSLALTDKDQIETPLSLLGTQAGPMGPVRRSEFGVLVQARAIQTLLAGGVFVALPAWGNLLVWLGLGLPTAWLARKGGLKGPVLIWLGYALANVLLFVFANVWAELALPLVGLPLVAGLGYYQKQAEEAALRRKLRTTISRYVSPEVLDEMLADPATHLRRLTEQREITVLFSDINDFSTHCERESPEDVARWLDEHYREMIHVIFAEQGTVVRFVGDQFMVLYGAPKPHPEPEKAAARTALAMTERLAELEKRGQRGFYHVKIGIHTGKMLLATVGDAEKSEYTAIGDAANLAARIQDLCKRLGVPILLSRKTAGAAGELEGIEFRDLGEHEVKGRQSHVGVVTAVRLGSPARRDGD